MDLTLPPPMARVIEVAVKFLNRAMYQPRDISLRSKWVRGKKRRDSLTSESELDDEETDSSALSTEEESSSEDSDDGVEERKKNGKRKARVKKKVEEKKDKGAKMTKEEEKSVVDQNGQSNIEDLAECFKQLKLRLGTGQPSQPPKTRSVMYCIMCGKLGHGIRDCSESKFFIGQDICRMDVNNRVVMSDGTALPCAEGEGGVAKQICDRMAKNKSSVPGPMSTSVSNVEVVAAEAEYYDDKPEELAILGSMEFEVLPAD